MKTKTKKTKLKLLVTGLLLFSVAFSFGQTNLVTNGNFENSNPLALTAPTNPANLEFETLGQVRPFGGTVVASLANWSFSGIVNIHNSTHWTMGSPPQGGNQHIDLNNNGSIIQTITGLQSGEEYRLTYYTSIHSQIGCGGGASYTVQMGYGGTMLSFNGNATTADIRVWTQRTHTFTALSSSETLNFFSTGSCWTEGGVLIDRVEITKVCDLECSDKDWVLEGSLGTPFNYTDNVLRIGNTGIGTFLPRSDFKLTVDNQNGDFSPTSLNGIYVNVNQEDCSNGYGIQVGANILGATKAYAVTAAGQDRAITYGNGMAWFSNRVVIGGDEPQVDDVCTEEIGDPILIINGEGTINGMNINSDQRFKENINTIEDTYSIIQKLNPVSYSYKTNEFNHRNFSKTPTYGFIAQEIKEVLPNVVRKEKDGYYSVNYIAVIPVLTQAIKEQQETIKQLEEKVAALAETNKEKGSFDETPKQKEELNTGAMLFQNSPNPLNNVTFIDYYLPANSNSAFVKVIDNNGKLVKAFPVNQKGYGQLELDCTNLQSGIYYYSLIVDKQVIDTLKMVVAKN